MPTCPSCGGAFRQRTKERCPGCGIRVKILHNHGHSIWVTEDASTKKLVGLLTEKIRGEATEFTFGSWKDTDYIRQLAAAKTLLEKCGGDQELAETVIETYFLGLANVWPPRNMLDVIGKKFNYVLGMAKKFLKKQRENQIANQQRLQHCDTELEVSFAI